MATAARATTPATGPAPPTSAAAPARQASSTDPARATGTPVLKLVPLRPVSIAGAPVAVRDVLGRSPGSPLPLPVRDALERSLGVDLAEVRIHRGGDAEALVTAQGARAFALGPHILLGPGESPDDLALMAHEVTHVVQQQGAPVVQRMAPSAASDVYEREASGVAQSVVGGQPAAVRQRTSPRPQHLFGWARRAAKAVAGAVEDAAEWVGDQLGKLLEIAIDFVKEQARRIPGYDMLALILGRDPITLTKVDRSPKNIIKAFMGLWLGGADIFTALDNNGVIDKVGNWVGEKVDQLKSVIGGLWDACVKFVKSLGLRDLAHPGEVWDRAKRIFTEPVDNAKKFVTTLGSEVIAFIREAILLPIAALAEKTPFYDLLKAVLKEDPVKRTPYPRNPETVIGGFMKMIGKEEIFVNMQKARALPRAFAWFNKALGELLGFVTQIPTVVINAFKSLTVWDMILVPRAFIKIGKAFGSFALKFVEWAGGTIWTLLEIIFDVVSPGALVYIKKTGAALKSIFLNPIPFMRNLVKAGIAGFDRFAKAFPTHMKNGLIDWLTGSMPGVYIPKAFELGEIVKFAFSVLGLSWANIRGKLVKATSETAVALMEGAFSIVVTLVREGPAAAWEQIKAQIDALKNQVIDGIVNMVVDAIAKQAVPKLLALFVPGAGFISAIVTIYDTIMVFVQKISAIIEVVTAFVDSIVNIAAGQIDGAAKKVESVLARLLSLAISFLAGFAGLGKIADKVMGVIKNVQVTIDKGLDALIEWIVTQAKKLVAWVFSKNPEDKRTEEQKKADLSSAKADAQTLQRKPKITEEEVRKGLPAIQKRYKLTSIALLVDSKDKTKEKVHIHVAINPEDDTAPDEIPVDPPGGLTVTAVKVIEKEASARSKEKLAGSEGDPQLYEGLAMQNVVKEDLIPEWSAQTGVPITTGKPELESAQKEARFKVQKGMRIGSLRPRPEGRVEIKEKGGKGAISHVFAVEVTTVRDLQDVKHKLKQLPDTIHALADKYPAATTQIQYTLIVPRKISDDERSMLTALLTPFPNMTIAWVNTGE